MSEENKRQPVAEVAKRGDAAWKAAKQAIAARNEQASKVAREKRQKRDDQHAAALRAADKRERVQLSKLKQP